MRYLRNDDFMEELVFFATKKLRHKVFDYFLQYSVKTVIEIPPSSEGLECGVFCDF